MEWNNSTIVKLFGIKYPIIQGGMVWCSGWKLASAVSNQGGLGLIGAGSMSTELLFDHINKCKIATNQPFGVNIPLLYPNAEEMINLVIQENIKIIFTSAGNPNLYTQKLKSAGCTVVHVVSSSKFAKKAEQAGVDVVVAEGFEAGGHNGKEETTTLCLIPEVVKAVQIPVIAAGGIGSGAAIVSCEALGADGVQIGSLFASTIESSAHQNFKEKITKLSEGETQLTLKNSTPVRIVKNNFFNQINDIENNNADTKLFSKGKSKLGIFEGDLENGKLEIGQVSSQIENIKSVKEIFNDLLIEYTCVKNKLRN